MGMPELIEAIDLINESGEGDFEGAKSPDLIKKAEQFLGVKFPPTYKEFLKELGCGDIGGKEFYGLINDQFENSSVPNAIWLTFDERTSSKLPKHFILVGQSIVGYYAIDTSKYSSDGECPIIDVVPGATDYEIIAQDFGSFLLSEVKSIL